MSLLCYLDISAPFRLINSLHPTLRSAYICATRLSHNLHVHTIISPTILPSSRSVCLFFSSPPVYFGTRHISRKSHASHFLVRSTSPSRSPQPYLSTPIVNPNNAVLSGRNSSLTFGCHPGGFFSWLRPIDRVCVLIAVHLCCVTSGGSQTCTIFFAHLRLPPLPVFQGQHSPLRLLPRPSFPFYRTDDIFLHCLSR